MKYGESTLDVLYLLIAIVGGILILRKRELDPLGRACYDPILPKPRRRAGAGPRVAVYPAVVSVLHPCGGVRGALADPRYAYAAENGLLYHPYRDFYRIVCGKERAV